MSAKRICRVCGCTEENGCLTASGPCHWVAEDLCSACLERAQNKPVITALDIVALQTVVFGVEIPGAVAFQILAALQLATRHPAFPPHTLETVRDFALVLQEQISVTENLGLLAAAGWDPQRDVPIEQEQPRIILP
jgi:hypothetical protein